MTSPRTAAAPRASAHNIWLLRDVAKARPKRSGARRVLQPCDDGIASSRSILGKSIVNRQLFCAHLDRRETARHRKCDSKTVNRVLMQGADGSGDITDMTISPAMEVAQGSSC